MIITSHLSNCFNFRGDTPALYQVLPERRVGLTSGMMASTHVYDINAANPGKIYFITWFSFVVAKGFFDNTEQIPMDMVFNNDHYKIYHSGN